MNVLNVLNGAPASTGGTAPAPRLDSASRLLAFAPPDALARFYVDTLGPLASGEAGDEELFLTLQEYVACGGNAILTARRLRMHRNTVLNRLLRIRDVLGVDVRESEPRFLVQLALYAGELTQRRTA